MLGWVAGELGGDSSVAVTEAVNVLGDHLTARSIATLERKKHQEDCSGESERNGEREERIEGPYSHSSGR